MKKTPKTEKPVINEQEQAQFEALCALAKCAAEFEREIETLSAEVDDARREAVDAVRDRIVELQAALLAAKADVERLCREHRAWFGGKQSLTLLDAKLAFQRSKSLVVPSEAATIAILESPASPVPAGDYVRIVKALDREALEKLDDKDLAKLGIARKETESFTLKAVKTDLSKTAAAEPVTEGEVAA